MEGEPLYVLYNRVRQTMMAADAFLKHHMSKHALTFTAPSTQILAPIVPCNELVLTKLVLDNPVCSSPALAVCV